MLKEHIADLLGSPITKITPLSGGDISQAYCIYSQSDRFFCKVNQKASAHRMFIEEKAGLEAIAQTKAIKAPKVLFCGQYESVAYLIIEFVESKSPSQSEMESLGHQLAALHKASVGNSFGWKTDNFIGNLNQSNKKQSDWCTFYSFKRLIPQLKLAQNHGYLKSEEVPSEESLLKTCQNLFPETSPSLLHGDLWSGNYLIAKNGEPYLIDPASYFGHYEVDLAMTRLFGGFHRAFYDAHAEHFPKVPGQNERNDIYQLYYLLVHLNLFGGSYYASVKQLLKRYFTS